MEFQLRAWTLKDVDSLPRYANNINIAKFMTDRFPHPYTSDHAREFIEMATQDDPTHIFAIDINGDGVGGIGLHPQQDVFKKNAELGYWLAEPYWGKGIITKAIKEVVEFGFRTFDVTRIFARPFGTNKASQRVLEKTGFTLEAKLEKTIYKNGTYLDECIYAIRK